MQILKKEMQQIKISTHFIILKYFYIPVNLNYIHSIKFPKGK